MSKIVNKNKKQNSLLRTVPIIFASFLIGDFAYAKVETVKTKIAKSVNTNQPKENIDDYFSKMTLLDKAKAESWRLSDKEWVRYKKLKEISPRGVWTPNIDPITLLGLEARTEQERAHYAKLFNDLETQRQIDDIAFGFAQNKDVQKRIPDHNAFKTYKQKQMERKEKYLDTISQVQFQQPTELVIYIDLSKKCVDSCRQKLLNKIKGNFVHFYFLNAKSDNELFKFVNDFNISGDKIKDGTYTLNYPDSKVASFEGAISIRTLDSFKNK